MKTVLEKIFFTLIIPGKEKRRKLIFKAAFWYCKIWIFQFFHIFFLLMREIILGSLLVLTGVMGYYQLAETRITSQIKLNLGKTNKYQWRRHSKLPLYIERIQSTIQENKEVYEKCSQQFLNVTEMFDNNMRLIRKIEPDKNSLEKEIKKCKEELLNVSVSF